MRHWIMVRRFEYEQRFYPQINTIKLEIAGDLVTMEALYQRLVDLVKRGDITVDAPTPQSVTVLSKLRSGEP